MRINFGEIRLGSVSKANLLVAIERNWITQGKLVDTFEKQWNNKFGYADSVAMSSGTDADINACLCLYDFGAERGDNIICPALTFIATANAILFAGFIPNFVDINRETLNIDETKIESAINKHTRAIMVTHVMGKPCEMDAIMDISRRHNLFVIEDSCEAHSMKYKEKYTGLIGDISTFSFYAAHILVSGEGGMCSTKHSNIGDILRSTRNHGRPPGTKYFNFIRTGLNSRMTDLSAAIALGELDQIDNIIAIRRSNKKKLDDYLSDLYSVFYTHHEEDYEYISPHAFPLIFKEDNENRYNNLYTFLTDSGIECKTLFSSVPTQHRAFNFMGYKLGDFPEAEFIGRNGLHFGLHQYLSENDLVYISDTIHRWVKKYC